MMNDSYDGVIESCRRSNYDDIADVIEHFGDHDVNQFGPVYNPVGAPNQETVDPFHVMWAFKAGRAYERGDGE